MSRTGEPYLKTGEQAWGIESYAVVTVLQQAGLPSTNLLSEHQFVWITKFFAIWKALEQLTGDSDLWIRFVEATNKIGH
jgi:hypothetical protein